ncbi:hypothetical protein ACEWY4_005932 [Coilia grayii]|uniref:Photoreceptor cilium actin regulator n=1 Tax=Coilia grayii TaxID=363190 RepID=A0ABD1KK36_9TELE
MGCSPSRGNQFTGAHSPFRRRRTLLPPSQENASKPQPHDGASEGTSTAGRTDGERCSGTSGERQATAKDVSMTLSAKNAVNEGEDCLDKLAPQEITVNILSQIKDKHGENQEVVGKKGNKKTKKMIKGIKAGRKKEKEKMTFLTKTKVDFPELLVKAHQAAYGYLNPSISKYEVLLGLLDHAAQTRMSLQPMVAFMIMRYEEINRGLEEIVEEGEKLLKEYGEYLAWPCHLKKLSNTPARTNTPSSPTEPPPDLLQQLLQYTIQRMHLVSQSVSGVGDTALEETVDYFTSVSDVLEEKLKVKRASEARLMQLLTHIEAATLRKPGPEDSALFSEDSGIGGESESFAGSDRHRHRRESCESTGTNRTSQSSPMCRIITPVNKGTGRYNPVHKMGSSLSLTSIDSFCNFAKEQRNSEFLDRSNSVDNDDEKEVGKYVDHEEGEQYNNRKCSSSSPLHICQQPRRLPSKRIENPDNIEMTLKLKDAISGRIRFLPSQKSNSKAKQTDSPKISRRQWNEEEVTPKRPQTPTLQPQKKKTTVTKHRRTHSADSIRNKAEDPTLLELERTQKDLTQRLERMSMVEGNIRNNCPKHGKGKTQPCSPSTSVHLQPLQRTPQSPSKSHKKSDRRTSSTKEKEIQKESNDSQNEKNDLEDEFNAKQASSSPTLQKPAGLYQGRNSVKRLIDTFSQGVEEIKQTPENAKILGPLKGVIKCGVPIIPGLGGAVLSIGNDNIRAESRSSDRTNDVDIDDLPPPPLEVLMDNSFKNVQKSEPEEGRSSRGHSPLLRRATVTQKLRASMQSVPVLPSRGGVRPGCLQQEVSTAPAASYQESMPEQKDNISSDAVSSTSESNCHPVAKSKTRARMLPSTPVSSCSLQRRLPSPPVYRRQPTPPSTPPVTHKLPTPSPVSQMRHTSNSATKQDGTLTSTSIYPFKTPSPPASPKVQRWSRDNSSDDSSFSSRVFSNARSVFCPASPFLFEAKPCPVPLKPQAWTSTSEAVTSYFWGECGNFPVSIRGPKPFIRRSQSDRRPSLNSPLRTAASIAETCGSEPAIATQELENGPSRDTDRWDNHWELTGTDRSASYPNLCIVGQALHPE